MLIIHGDNIIASREFFLIQKKSILSDVLELNGQELSYSRLVQALTTPNLFGEYPVIFIENFFSRRPSNEKKQIIEYLKGLTQNIYIYESKDVSLQLKSFDSKNIKNFRHPKYIYSFLETLSLSDLKSCLSVDPPELIIGALAKHLHNLILIKENQGSLPDWQAAKLKSQAHKYSQEKLCQLSQSLLEIDYKQKTSASPQNLASALELWTIKV